MESIKAVLLEPAGCLADVAPDAFNSAAAELFGASPDAAATGSQAYWHLLGLMEARPARGASLARLQGLELAAPTAARTLRAVRYDVKRGRNIQGGFYGRCPA